jgi:hypothetical protein
MALSTVNFTFTAFAGFEVFILVPWPSTFHDEGDMLKPKTVPHPKQRKSIPQLHDVFITFVLILSTYQRISFIKWSFFHVFQLKYCKDFSFSPRIRRDIPL